MVNCDRETCEYNVAGECTNRSVTIYGGICTSCIEGLSTGEVIDTDTDELLELEELLEPSRN